MIHLFLSSLMFVQQKVEPPKDELSDGMAKAPVLPVHEGLPNPRDVAEVILIMKDGSIRRVRMGQLEKAVEPPPPPAPVKGHAPSNRMGFTLGQSQDGLKIGRTEQGGVRVEKNMDAVFGAYYLRDFGSFNMMVSGLSNDTFLIGSGFSF